jgi:hypothetical protein
MKVIHVRRLSFGSYVKLLTMAATPVGILLGVLMGLSEMLSPGSAYFSVFQWEFHGTPAILLCFLLFPLWWILILGAVAGCLTYPVMLLWWHFLGGCTLRCDVRNDV